MLGRFILTLSAAILFVGGAVAAFAAEEVARAIDADASAAFPVVVQVAAGGFLAFALVNWMSRKNRIGGIYARPLALGNLLLFSSSALAVGNAADTVKLPSEGIVVCAVAALLAVSFAWLIFFHDPVEARAA